MRRRPHYPTPVELEAFRMAVGETVYGPAWLFNPATHGAPDDGGAWPNEVRNGIGLRQSGPGWPVGQAWRARSWAGRVRVGAHEGTILQAHRSGVWPDSLVAALRTFEPR